MQPAATPVNPPQNLHHKLPRKNVHTSSPQESFPGCLVSTRSSSLGTTLRKHLGLSSQRRMIALPKVWPVRELSRARIRRGEDSTALYKRQRPMVRTWRWRSPCNPSAAVVILWNPGSSTRSRHPRPAGASRSRSRRVHSGCRREAPAR